MDDDGILRTGVLGNEVGMIPEARDHRPEATDAIASTVPADLTTYLTDHRQRVQTPTAIAWQRMRTLGEDVT